MFGFFFRLIVVIIFANAMPAQAKLQAKIVSYPIANTILSKFADAYGSKSKKYMAPLVTEGIGSKSISNFCAVNGSMPDVLVTHKKLTYSDLTQCSSNHINELIELELGHGGVVVLASPDLNLSNLSLQDLYLAITKLIYRDGRVVTNSIYSWSELSGNGYDLPAVPIKILIPGANADLRDVFEDRILVNGCQMDPKISELRVDQPKLYRDLCLGVRSDRAVEDFDKKGSRADLSVLDVISQGKGVLVLASPDILLTPGIDRYVVAVDGFKPTYESIRDDSYPLSSPIYMYVKLSSLKTTKSLKSFLRYIFSSQNKASHLSEPAGFLSLDDAARARQFDIVNAGYANFQLEQPDIIDQAIDFVKNPGFKLPESPAEPELPPTFVGTSLDKDRESEIGSADFDSRPPSQGSTIDDQLHQTGEFSLDLSNDGNGSGVGDKNEDYDVPADDSNQVSPQDNFEPESSWKNLFN